MRDRKNRSLYRRGYVFCLFIIVIAPFNVFALESVKFAIKELCLHMEGSLGGLLMVAAGVGGMISAAFGNMKALYSCIITGIGAFTVSSMLSLYFPEAAKICSGAAGTTRTKVSVEATNVSQVDEVAAVHGLFKSTKSEAESNSESFGDEEASDAEIF